MDLPISILKNILDFKCMHIENSEIIDTVVKTYEESHTQKILMSFFLEYVTMDFSEIDESQKKKAGRPKKEQFTPEHEASLSELKKKTDDVKDSRYALGHKPSKCTESQNGKLRISKTSPRRRRIALYRL
ncbi:MAG: hypothetical protein Q4D76_16665 [Oscillospiraceae bacterium]|nr:hypothetical protein [Oscillospiraceae bacterium]